jgi:rubredoxin
MMDDESTADDATMNPDDITPGMAWKDIPREWRLLFVSALRDGLTKLGSPPGHSGYEVICNAAVKHLAEVDEPEVDWAAMGAKPYQICPVCGAAYGT